MHLPKHTEILGLIGKSEELEGKAIVSKPSRPAGGALQTVEWGFIALQTVKKIAGPFLVVIAASIPSKSQANHWPG